MNAKTISEWETFREHVGDLYKNLYDPVYLRTHTFRNAILAEATGSRIDRGWQLHNLLIDAIEGLNPGVDAPAFSLPWRRYHLMLSRYVDGLAPDEVARELAISRRQFFREQKEALEAVAVLLARRLTEAESGQDQAKTPTTAPDQVSLERVALLRVETARMKRSNRYARMPDVVDGVLMIMKEMLDHQQIELIRMIPDSVPVVSVDPSLLRQILLGIFDCLTVQAVGASMCLTTEISRSRVDLRVRSNPPVSSGGTLDDTSLGDQVVALQEMASLSQVDLRCCYEEGMLSGFDIALPIARCTVLVLDDNGDVLELFTRYLESSHYRVVTSERASEAIALSVELQPDVIILDLMMPELDGWDVLQTLLQQPETSDIPVIICSVLKQKRLALSLGATAFLEKPVDKQTLISAIQALT